jgi:DNA-directed RNA polymerase omega subunit
MSDLPIEKLLPKADYSIYRLASLAANRALELSDGRRCLAQDLDTEKFTTMALHEIAQGKVMIKGSEEAKAMKTQEQEQSEEKQEAVAE